MLTRDATGGLFEVGLDGEVWSRKGQGRFPGIKGDQTIGTRSDSARSLGRPLGLFLWLPRRTLPVGERSYCLDSGTAKVPYACSCCEEERFHHRPSWQIVFYFYLKYRLSLEISSHYIASPL
jgi:hypothetical protein